MREYIRKPVDLDPYNKKKAINDTFYDATGALFVRPDSSNLIVTPEWFRRNSSQTDNDLLQYALTLMKDGETLYLEPKDYEISVVCQRLSGSLILRGRGARLKQMGDNSVLAFQNQYGDQIPIAIGGINNAYEANFSETYPTPPAQPPKTFVAALTPTAIPTGLKIGSICKIFSDDLAPGEDPSLDSTAANTKAERAGEFFRVAAWDGTVILTNHQLRNTYTNNVRIAVLDTTMRITVSDLEFCSDPAAPSTWKAGYMIAQALYRPSFTDIVIRGGDGEAIETTPLDPYAGQGPGAGITVIGCFGAVGTRLHFAALRNNPSTPDPEQYGYGWNDVSSGYTTLSQITGIRCRHLLTTNINAVVKGSTETYAYGGSECGVIADATAMDVDSPFDVHADADNWTFIGCTARGAPRAKDIQGGGFQIRGRNQRLIGCSAVDTYTGFHLYEQFAGGTQNIELIDCSYQGPGVAILCDGEDPSTFAKMRSVVSGFRFSGSSSLLVATSGVTKLIGKTRVDWSNQTPDRPLILKQINAEIEVEDLDLDMAGTSSTITGLRVCKFGAAGGGVTLNGRIRNAPGISVPDGIPVPFCLVDAGSRAAELRIGSRYRAFDCDKILTNYVLDAGSLTLLQRYVTTGGDKKPGSTEGNAINATTGANLTFGGATNVLTLNNSVAPRYTILVQPTSAATVTSIASGAFQGQMLSLVASSTAGFSLTVATSAADLGTARVLSAGQALSLVWHGSSWIAAA